MNKLEFKEQIRSYLKTIPLVTSCSIEVLDNKARLRDVNNFYLSLKPSKERTKDDLEKMKLLKFSKTTVNQILKFCNTNLKLLDKKENFTFYYLLNQTNKNAKDFKNILNEYLSDIPEISYAYIHIDSMGITLSEINKTKLRVCSIIKRYGDEEIDLNISSLLIEANLKQSLIKNLELFLTELTNKSYFNNHLYKLTTPNLSSHSYYMVNKDKT